MKKELFYIQPLNEGQELNYIETFEGPFAEAKTRASELIAGLIPVLREGTISAQIENSKTGTVYHIYFDRGKDKFVTEILSGLDFENN